MEDPLNIHIFPKSSKRKAQLQSIYLPEVYYCFEKGLVYATSEKLEGVALWLTDRATKKNLSTLIRGGGLRVIFRVPIDVLFKLMHYDKFSRTLRERFAPDIHWYLHNIAVQKGYRGKGFAGKLLKPIFQMLDKLNLPCYLETQNPQNVALYEHYGFRIVWMGTIPGLKGVTHWGMLREAYA